MDQRVTRRAFFAILPMVGLSMPALGAKRGFHITGRLDAHEQEAQEGYFVLGADLAIVTRPHSPIHDDLLAMRGTDVQVSVFNP